MSQAESCSDIETKKTISFPEKEAVGLDKETAKKGTISYGILQAHNCSGDPKNLNLFLLSVANVAINVLLAALGVFSLGGIFY